MDHYKEAVECSSYCNVFSPSRHLGKVGKEEARDIAKAYNCESGTTHYPATLMRGQDRVSSLSTSPNALI